MRSATISAEYSSQIVVSADTIWVGLQDTAPTHTSHSHVLGFDYAGGMKTNIQVPADEGAFLYTFAVAPSIHLVAVGSDDGKLSLFQAENE